MSKTNKFLKIGDKKMRFKCEKCNIVKEISDEEIEKILVMHKAEKEEKEKNLNNLQEVAKVIATIEEQLKGLKLNVQDLESKIKESDEKINEEIVLG